MSGVGGTDAVTQLSSAAEAGDADAEAFEALVGEIDSWIDSNAHWTALRPVRDDWSDAGARLAGVGRELSRVLVVGVIGGTGTGKSTLVNALAGAEVSPAGDVVRPTTRSPVVVAAGDTDCSWLPLADWNARVVRTASAALAGVVLVDCPDPDTQDDPDTRDGRADLQADPRGGDPPNRNREILESVLPSCDVLLLVSTAQKYRSWAVAREVLRFAPGRPLLFVQTHASRDPDIRDDWKRALSQDGFDVPVMHRLDGVEAIRRAREGLPPEPGFAELCASIQTELAGRAAVRVRRTGAIDLMDWFLRRTAARLAGMREPLAALENGIAGERARLERVLASRLAEQLRAARGQWQRLLARELAGEGRGGPFGVFLSLVDRLAGAWPALASGGSGLVGRALAGRSSVAPAVRPASDGAADRPGGGASIGMTAIHEVGLTEADVEQSRSILVGLAARARIEEPRVGRARLPAAMAAAVVAEVLSRAGRWLDDGIGRLVEARHGRLGAKAVRWTLEIAFCGFVLAILGRAAWSFFYDRLWAGQPSAGGGLLWEAVPWILLWGFFLRWVSGVWMRRGLEEDVRTLVAGLPQARLVDPILEDFSDAARETVAGLATFDALVARSATLTTIPTRAGGGLGRLRREPGPAGQPVADASTAPRRG
jgi:energy-coupling factor transporter ATP-binding protein EcfA2